MHKGQIIARVTVEDEAAFGLDGVGPLRVVLGSGRFDEAEASYRPREYRARQDRLGGRFGQRVSLGGTD